MAVRDWLERVLDWPVLRQVRDRDAKGLGRTAFSRRTIELTPRTTTSEKVVKSVCPYCAVGCGQRRTTSSRSC